MGWGHHPLGHCRWVRDRLPLLDGGELVGTERRKAERHLIACADCRRERAALGRSLDVLHAFAEFEPADPAAPSLWPALERQIRESRHESRRPSWSAVLSDLTAWLDPPVRPRVSLVSVLTVALAGLSALGVGVWSRSTTASANARAALVGRPLERRSAEFDLDPNSHFDPESAFVGRESAVPNSASMSEPLAKQDRPPTASRVDYDLDHGTPLRPAEARGFKSSY